MMKFTVCLKGNLKILNNKLLSLLGFAAKAGKLSYGFEATKYSILSKKAKLSLVSEEISAKSQKEIIYFSDKNNIKTVILKGIDIKTMSDAVGKKCGILSVNDSGFADACLKYTQV